VLEAIEELVWTLRQDPDAWMLHRLARSYFLIIMRRPLLTAVFLADSELLGKLARPDTEARKQRHHLSSRAYFELLAEHGLLRADYVPTPSPMPSWQPWTASSAQKPRPTTSWDPTSRNERTCSPSPSSERSKPIPTCRR
jgi:hypothetical protein